MNEYRENAGDDEISEVFTPVTYSKLSAPLKEEVRLRLEELIFCFINEIGCAPEESDAEEILPMFCKEFCEAIDGPPDRWKGNSFLTAL
jgi:hypothetical protein